MLHAKFQDHRTSASGEEDCFKFFYHIWYDHLGLVTWTISLPFPRRLHIKFGLDWPRGLRGKDV